MRTAIRVLLVVVALAHAGATVASDQSSTMVPEKGGDGSCKFWAKNSAILQMGSSAVKQFPTSGTGSVLVKGPDNTATSANPESATIFGLPTNVGFRTSTTPVDFAVLRSGNDIVLLYYPSGGVTGDANMKLVVGNKTKVLDQVNLCYGLKNVTQPPPPPPPNSPISSCTSGCPSDGVKRLMCKVSLDAASDGQPDATPFSGGVTAGNCCVCNGDALPSCGPSLAAGTTGSCIDAGGGSSPKAGLEVPISIELNQDPYVCTTSGGLRSCYKY